MSNPEKNQIEGIQLSLESKQLISTDQAWHYRVVPQGESNGTIHLYIDDTVNLDEVKDELEVVTGKGVLLTALPAEIIEEALNKYYLRNDRNTASVHSDFNSENFVSNLLGEAKSFNSSDIHIEIYDDRCRVRFRIDGQLIERIIIPKSEYPSLINKIKIMSNLDIAEKRLPQDGRIFFNVEGDRFDIRVSVLPTLHGEKIVLRILGNSAANLDINLLGFSKEDLFNYLEGIKKPNGIILISGPTGSGKTTTLYATLKLLNKNTTNILTIEDPIEYTLEGINQVQLRENIGMDFAKALRTFLRQDPDIIMVGEIRDTDTANMAIRAALTGHLVLSTIHTNSAWGTISRLLDMGVPSFLLANTLNLSVAQRLIRLLCPSCKEKVPFEGIEYPRNFRPAEEVFYHYKPKGCKACFHTGYKGRKALYEVIPIDQDLSEKIRLNIPDIKEDLKNRQIKTLSENAFEVFASGLSSFQEVYPLLSAN